MDISGKPVLFHVSAQGGRAVRALVPRKGSFRALILAMDPMGAWILLPGASGGNPTETVPVILLKWEYVSTVVFDFKPEVPPRRVVAGFVQKPV